MGFALTLYVTPLDRVHAAVGSRDDKLRRMISGRFKDDMARTDRFLSSAIEAVGAPSMHDALRAVIEGGPFERAHAFQYYYAYERICRHFGKYLNNNDFSPFRGDWLAQVDAGFAALGVDMVEVSAFMHGAPPAPLPRPDDLLGYGEWTQSRCRQALAQYDASAAEARSQLPPRVRDAIESCVGWMRAARAEASLGVVGFFF